MKWSVAFSREFFKKLLILVMALFFLTACGGGGGGGDSTDAKGSGEWDSMVWGQDNWA